MTCSMIPTLRVVEDGEPTAWLPDWLSLELTLKRDGENALSVGYYRDGRNADLLAKHRQVVLLLDGEEPKNARYVVETDSSNRVGDDRRKLEYKLVGLVQALSWGQITPEEGEQSRSWSGQKTGRILRQILEGPADRGCFDWWGYDGLTFDDDEDSNGEGWPDKQTREHKYGQDVLKLWKTHYDEGFAEFGTDRNKLEAFAYDKRGRERDVNLWGGRDVTEAPVDRDWSDYVTDLLVVGKEKKDDDDEGEEGRDIYEWVKAGERPHGRFEDVLKLSNVGDRDMMREVGEKHLEVYGRDPLEMDTYQIAASSPHRPLFDFGVGDTIHVNVDGEWRDEIVEGVTASWDGAKPADWKITTMNLLKVAEEKLERRIKVLEDERRS